MKTTGAEWNAYLASWPDGQWFDDGNETFDGKEPTTEEAPPEAVVEFSCGVIFDTHGQEVGDLVRHFSKWRKSQVTAFMFCEVPKGREDEFRALVAGIGGKVRSA